MISKAELHIHIEGAIALSLARQLARKNNIHLSSSIFADENNYAWNDFSHFLKAYDVVASLIKSPEDCALVIYEYLKQSANEGVIYNELIISPMHFSKQGMSYLDMLEGAKQGILQAKKEFGIETRLLIAAVRHEGVDVVEKVIREMIDYPDPYVVGINLAGDEIKFPPKLFKNAFDAAFKAGYGCVAHAGEIIGPESIWEVLEYLPVSRIGHGVRSIEDPDLIKELIKREITLEVCPSSNVALGVFPSYENHPLRKLYEAGIKVTLNSDDPYFFNTTIGKEYQIARDKFHLSDDDLIKITKTAIENSFAGEATKKLLLTKV